jgi:hypothetical protein
MGTGALSVVVKKLKCEADHSPPSSVKNKNVQSFTFPNIFGVCLSTETTLIIMDLLHISNGEYF